jgi:serpin B
MNKVLWSVISVLMLTLLVGLAACSPATAGDLIQSDEPRDMAPEVSADDLNTLVDGNSAFAFDLYQQLKDEGGNLFYSPYSISLALAMTYGGARGETETQMADALNFSLPQNQLHPAFNALSLALASRGQGAEGKDDEGFRLNIVNAIWGQQDYVFLSDFLDLLAVNYSAGLRVLDFINETEKSRVIINDWVADQTEGRIEDLIPAGALTPLTRLVLTNAIYFNAKWLHTFEAEMTRDGLFHLLDGSEVTVPMMSQTESFKYAEGEGYQAVELRYDGEELSMVILLPASGQFEAFEAALDAETVAGIIEALDYREVDLTMPKFEFDSSFSLRTTLSAMGMPIAFDPYYADFSGMSDSPERLYITEVVHKAFVSVDEEGTEAAAATAVIVGETALPPAPVTMTIDRPFIFLIRDIETGTILFLGRTLDPSA